MKNRNLQLIKYDKQDYKISLLVAISISLCWIVLLILHAIDTLPDNTIVALLYLLLLILPWIVIISWLYVLETWSYLSRLKKHGYEVPKHKKEYGCHLGKLLKSEKRVAASAGSWESITMTIACFICAGAVPIFLLHMWLGYDYHILQDIKYQGYGILFVVFVIWFAEGLRYWRQRSDVKFRDDVELDDSRKQRKQIADGMGEILALFGFSFLLPTIIMHLLDVVARARM